MGWLSDAFSWVADDVLGFDPPKPSAPVPTPQQAVGTTDQATNTPAPAPATQVFSDQVKSYLAAQAQRAFNLQLKKSAEQPPTFEPPTFGQTEQGQKLIKFGIIAGIAWLFFKG